VIVLLLISSPLSASPLPFGEQLKLAILRANDSNVVALSVVSKTSRNARSAGVVEHLRGRVRYRVDAVDFLSIVLPMDRVSKFLDTAPIEAVTIDLQGTDDEAWFSAPKNPTIAADDQKPPRPEAAAWPPMLSHYPLDNPYSALKDLNGSAFRSLHPTYDGRGVVIAQVEAFPDFLLPELKDGYDQRGNRVSKFRDIINVPELEPSLRADANMLDWRWVQLSRPMVSRSSRLCVPGTCYRLPAPGTYRFGTIKLPYELASAIGLGKSVKEKFIELGVLWSDQLHSAWLDSNQDQDFSDEVATPEFKLSGRFGVLGVHKNDGAARRTVGFAVQKQGQYLSINFGDGDHASMVAGAAAANRGVNGLIDGVAPGAQLLTINTGTLASTFARGLVTAFTDSRTDIVLVEAHYPSMGNYEAADGRSMFALLLAKLVRRYGKPCFVTADNTPGMSTVEDTSVPPEVISVGAYQSADSVFVNNGILVSRQDSLHFVGSEGPAGNGALKPDLLAPANPMTLKPGFLPNEELEGLYVLPTGYQIGGGTSTATPVAAGAAALLLSAAKQQSIAVSAEAMYRALRSSARFLQGILAYQQGDGLIQIEPSWDRLREIAHNGMPPRFLVRAPVRTATSKSLEIPDTGTGLFEREGWTAGDKDVRYIQITRDSGAADDPTFHLSWDGNEGGTFAGPATVTLPLNKPVRIAIEVHPALSGAHSAILHLDGTGYSGHVLSIPVTIVAAPELSLSNGYALAVPVSVDRPGRHSEFFRVPSGVAALTIEVEHNREWLIGGIVSPENVPQQPILVVDPIAGKRSITISDPTPGVWETTLYDIGESWKYDWRLGHKTLPATVAQVRARAFGVTVTDSTRESDASGRPHALDVKNDFAEFNGSAVSGALISIRSVSLAVNGFEQRVFPLNLDDGASLLGAEVRTTQQEAISVNVFLFSCTTGRCLPVRSVRGGRDVTRALIEKPSHGVWKIVVSLSSTGNTPQVAIYDDYIADAKLGTLTSTDLNGRRAIGERWSVEATALVKAKPNSGRSCASLVFVQSPDMRTPHRRIEDLIYDHSLLPYSFTNYATDVSPLGVITLAIR